MAIQKKKRSSSGGGWLDTYADMVTLLLTFFVLLFSMSSVEEEKWQKLVLAFSNPGNETNQVVIAPDEKLGDDQAANVAGDKSDADAPPTELDSVEFSNLYEYLESYVAENGLEDTVEVSEGENSVYIRFSDVVAFTADSSVLQPESYVILEFLGDALKQVEEELMSVVIAGHTALVDGPYKISDRRLSGDRASSVAIYFENEKGIDPKKTLSTGYGGNYPVDSNATDAGREQNRRVELMILSNDADKSNAEIADYFLQGTYDVEKYPATGGVDDVIIPPESDVISNVESDVVSNVESDVVSNVESEQTVTTPSE